MIKLNNYKSLESINKDFFKLSNYFQSVIGKYWWFMNFSRLDLAPLGIPKNESFFEKIKNYSFSFLIFLKFFSHTFFTYKKKILKKYNKIFVFEEIQLNFTLKKKEDYYFKNISKLTNLKFKNLIVGLKVYNDNKNYSIFELFERKEILKIFVKSLLIYLKFFIRKNEIINRTKNVKFWKIYQKKNTFLNFFLTNLIYNFFTKYNFKKNIIIYPYEEKPFERAININIKKNYKRNYKIFAYLINPRDNLALYFNRYDGLNIPRCHKYLFPGNISKTRFLENLRENLLSDMNPVVGLSKGKIKKVNFNKSNSFLVLIGHPFEFTVIFDTLKKKFNQSNIKFIFRFPPGIDTKYYKKVLYKYENFSISKNSSLSKDCDLVKYSIFSNTSAGIESVNLGLVAIWFQTYNLKISPLNKKDHKFFFTSKNGKVLFEQINKLVYLNKKSYENYQMKQFKITSNMYSKFNQKKFKSLINA